MVDCLRLAAEPAMSSERLAKQVAIENFLDEVGAQSLILHLTVGDLVSLLQCSCVVKQQVDVSDIWSGFAQKRFLRGPSSTLYGTSGVHWKAVCLFYDKLWHSWHGGLVPRRLRAAGELSQPSCAGRSLACLRLLQVVFINPRVLAIGHSEGVVSIWLLSSSEHVRPYSSMQHCLKADSGLQHKLLRPPLSKYVPPSFSQSLEGGEPWHHACPPPISSHPMAQVIAVLHTSEVHDVSDLVTYPVAAAEPAALLLGRTVWLAAAVGTQVFVWRSINSEAGCDPGDVFSNLRLHGIVDHSIVFFSQRDEVRKVRIDCSVSSQQYVVTAGEDGVLRSWHLGSSCIGEDTNLIWQQFVGDCRQVVFEILPLAIEPYRSVVLLARADIRSFQVVDTVTGSMLSVLRDVWPAVAESLPQSAAFDLWRPSALFCAITNEGNGVLSHVDLRPLLIEFDSPESLHMVEITGTLAGSGRLLWAALPVPAVDMVVAIVNEGLRVETLEVWDWHSALDRSPCNGRSRCRCHVCLGSHAGKHGLIAAAGLHVAVLNPDAFRHRGELLLLEWCIDAAEQRPVALASSARKQHCNCLAGFVQVCSREGECRRCTMM